MTEGSDGTIARLVEDGRLTDAVAAATAAVKLKPTSAPDRILLADLLVLEGALERADAQLQLATDQAPAEALAISQSRQLLRAAEARRAWYRDAAVPEFVDKPTPLQSDVMRLALAVRAGDAAEAARLRDTLEAMPVPVAACDGQPACEVRDVCDLSQHGFEALTINGRYLWLAASQVETIRFTAARRPRDLVWRHAEVTLRDGRTVVFFIVAQYWDEDADDGHRLARSTDWVESVGGVMRGRGQRMLLVGEEARSLVEIASIDFREAGLRDADLREAGLREPAGLREAP